MNEIVPEVQQFRSTTPETRGQAGWMNSPGNKTAGWMREFIIKEDLTGSRCFYADFELAHFLLSCLAAPPSRYKLSTTSGITCLLLFLLCNSRVSVLFCEKITGLHAPSSLFSSSFSPSPIHQSHQFSLSHYTSLSSFHFLLNQLLAFSHSFPVCNRTTDSISPFPSLPLPCSSSLAMTDDDEDIQL